MVYLFDIDGTLIGSDGAGRRALDRAFFELCGVEQALAQVTLHGNTDPFIVRDAYLAHLGRPPTEREIQAILERYLHYLEQEMVTCAYHVKPGVEATLDLLSTRETWIGLATGNVQTGARLKLERGGLWRRFSFGGFGSDAAERGKLVRVSIGRAEMLAQRKFLPEEIFVIGDTPRDIAAAHACSARAIAIATGPHSVEELRAADADQVFSTMTEWQLTL